MPFEYNLVPCVREPFPERLAFYDLTQNLEVAHDVIGAVQGFFRFQAHWPIYSGRVRRSEAGPLYVQIWRDGEVERSAAFLSTGYAGVLNVDAPPDDVGQYRYLDLIGEAFRGFHERGTIQAEGAERDTLAVVEGNLLLVALPWR